MKAWILNLFAPLTSGDLVPVIEWQSTSSSGLCVETDHSLLHNDGLSEAGCDNYSSSKGGCRDYSLTTSDKRCMWDPIVLPGPIGLPIGLGFEGITGKKSLGFSFFHHNEIGDNTILVSEDYFNDPSVREKYKQESVENFMPGYLDQGCHSIETIEAAGMEQSFLQDDSLNVFSNTSRKLFKDEQECNEYQREYLENVFQYPPSYLNTSCDRLVSIERGITNEECRINCHLETSDFVKHHCSLMEIVPVQSSHRPDFKVLSTLEHENQKDEFCFRNQNIADITNTNAGGVYPPLIVLELETNEPRDIASAHECQNLCQVNSECVYFSWVSLPSQKYRVRTCHLYTELHMRNRDCSFIKPDTTIISGPKYCDPIETLDLSLDDLETCKNRTFDAVQARGLMSIEDMFRSLIPKEPGDGTGDGSGIGDGSNEHHDNAENYKEDNTTAIAVGVSSAVGALLLLGGAGYYFSQVEESYELGDIADMDMESFEESFDQFFGSGTLKFGSKSESLDVTAIQDDDEAELEAFEEEEEEFVFE